MKNAYLSILFCLLACKPAEELPFFSDSNSPIDTGIYEPDSTKSDAFCDFLLESNTENCWNESVNVYQDCHYNLLFTRYGNGWTGSDATYSIPLPDGRILWMFGDTFLGTVRADRSREGAPFIRNSFMIQDRDEFITLFHGTLANPSAYIKPQNPNQWYWPLDGTVYNGGVQMMLGRFGTTGTGGMWDFQYVGIDRAVFSLPDMQLISLEEVLPTGDISFGAAVMEDNDYIYIYGISFVSIKRLHVARAPLGDLSAKWEFYNGQTWVENPSSYAMLAGVSDQLSVFKEDDKYYLMTQQTFFGKKLLLYEADSPVGPWRNKKTLYCTPEAEGDIFTYNAFVHPELSENGELRISYNINSFNFQDIFDNADNYRPKFIRVDNWK